MKIVYCTTQLSSAGGIERVLCNKINWLIENGHEVTIITTDGPSRNSFFPLNQKAQLIDLGLNYKADYNNPIWKRYLLWKRKIKVHRQKLSELLYEIKADFVISTFQEDASILPTINDGSIKILEAHNSKYVYRNRADRKWFDPRNILDRFYEYYDGQISSKFDRFVLLTTEDMILRGNRHNMMIIPNPVPLDFATATPSKLDKKIVLAVGRHTEQKNFSDLIDIWHTIAKDHPDWTLRIIGDGHLKEQLEDKIRRFEIRAIELLPPTNDIIKHYQEASLLCLTSRFEGFGLVLVEAMSCGLPVVSYDCPCGPLDIINHNIDGVIIPLGNKEEFAHRLSQIMDDDIRIKEMGKQAIISSKRYHIDHIMRMWIDLFTELKRK